MSTPKTVGDIMTRKVVVLREEDNLERLDEGMERFHFRHLPVVDGERLVGLISHRDLLRLGPSLLLGGGSSVDVERKKEGTFVANIMTREVRTVSEATTLAEAARILVGNKVGCLPVVDGEHKLLGIVTAHDFLRLAADMLEKQ